MRLHGPGQRHLGAEIAPFVEQGLMHDVQAGYPIRGCQPVGCQLPVGPDVCTNCGRQVQVPDIQAGEDEGSTQLPMCSDMSSSAGPWASSHSLLRYSQWW